MYFIPSGILHDTSLRMNVASPDFSTEIMSALFYRKGIGQILYRVYTEQTKKYPDLQRNLCSNRYFGGHFCISSDLPVENQSKNIECTKQMSSPGDSKMSRDSWLEEQQQQKHIIIPALAPKNLGLVVKEESSVCKKPRKRQILLNLVAF